MLAYKTNEYNSDNFFTEDSRHSTLLIHNNMPSLGNINSINIQHFTILRLERRINNLSYIVSTGLSTVIHSVSYSVIHSIMYNGSYLWLRLMIKIQKKQIISCSIQC